MSQTYNSILFLVIKAVNCLSLDHILFCLRHNNGLSAKTTFDMAAENSYWNAMQPVSEKTVTQSDNNLLYAGIAVIAAIILATILSIRKK